MQEFAAITLLVFQFWPPIIDVLSKLPFSTTSYLEDFRLLSLDANFPSCIVSMHTIQNPIHFHFVPYKIQMEDYVSHKYLTTN